MADIFDFYVHDDRSIRYELAEPIMLEDKDVTQFRFRIPKSLNGFDMSDWEWWFVFVNPKGTKYTTLLELSDDEDEPDEYSVATYTVGYGFSGIVGTVRFSIEALNVSGEGIINEWHTKTYSTAVIDTLQGLRAVVPEPDGQVSSGLTQQEKNLILTLFSKAKYDEDDAKTAYEALEALWTVTTQTVTYNLSHVTSSNTTSSAYGGSRYTTTLTAMENYILNTVTVTMGGVDVTSTYYNSGTITIPRVTGDIIITASAVLEVSSLSAVYTQSGTVRDTDSLDVLKSDLVVTATYPDSSTAVIDSADYTLSGTLTERTSTITVVYGGKTTTFSVTVTSSAYTTVSWLFNENTPQYAIGDTSMAYQAWCPHNLQFDDSRNKFIFTQQHSSKHGSGATVAPATMYEIDPSDPLKKIQIQIPEIIGIANLVILPDGKYVLYPKTATSVRYVSDDGGATWTSENLSGSSQHFFGVYYCNGAYYAGCDYEWAEYHYSEDGLNWTTKSIGADSTDYEMRTKEHSFCYWKGHVYAFGRRDWYDANNNLIEDRNDCSIVYRLDGEEWTVIDDSSLLAFQSDCCPVAFSDCIAIVHTNRTSNATLNYSIYDGTTFSTIKTWSGLVLPNCQNAFTTPTLAFGNGYVCIAYSTMPVLHQLNTAPYYRAINSIIIGTTEGKTTKDYFTHEQLSTADAPNISKTFALTPEKLKFFPSGAETDIAWRWNTGAANPNYDSIINNGTNDVYYYFTDYPNLMHVHIDNGSFLVKDGKFVRTVTAPISMVNDTQKNFIFQYDNRWFAVGGKSTDYDTTMFQCAHQFVVECSFTDSPTQPSVDISGVPDGTVLRLVSANGGVNEKIKKNVTYITPISTSTS